MQTTEDEIKYIFVAIMFKIPSDLDVAPHYKLLTSLSTLTLNTYTHKESSVVQPQWVVVRILNQRSGLFPMIETLRATLLRVDSIPAG